MDFKTAWALAQQGKYPSAEYMRRKRKSRLSPSTRQAIAANNAEHDSNTRAFNRIIDDLLKQGRDARYGS